MRPFVGAERSGNGEGQQPAGPALPTPSCYTPKHMEECMRCGAEMVWATSSWHCTRCGYHEGCCG